MKKSRILIFLLCICMLLPIVNASAAYNASLTMRLSTRTGPSTSYTEPGTFFTNWQGVTVDVISKAFNNGVWWVQVEFTNGGKLYRAYTGAKRVNINVDVLPEEDDIGFVHVTYGDITAYSGPGTHYAQMPSIVKQGKFGLAYARENGYVQFDYTQDNGQACRVWAPESQVYIEWHNGNPPSGYTGGNSGGYTGGYTGSYTSVSIPAMPLVAAGWDYVAGLSSNGYVYAAGDNKAGQCNVQGWNNVIQIAAANVHTVGLLQNGRVLATGSNSHGETNVGGWYDIVQVSAGEYLTLGLKNNGTVVATGNNDYGQCNVYNWYDIVQVEAGMEHAVGLRSNGTVVSTGRDKNGLQNVYGWSGVVQIDAGKYHTVGLTQNGTILATGKLTERGSYPYDQSGILRWSNIAQVAAGDYHTVGLRRDGTVVAEGWNKYGQCNVGGWTNIVAVAAGTYNTIGLKADGTIVMAGRNDKNQFSAMSWNLFGYTNYN